MQRKMWLGLAAVIFLLWGAVAAAAQGDDQALPLAFGDQVAGQITAEKPVMVYRFEGQQDEAVTITMLAIEGDLDPYLLLLRREEGRWIELTYNDDAPDAAGSAKIAAFRLPQTGTYYVAATRYGRELGTTTGRFDLSLQRAEPSAPGDDGLWIYDDFFDNSQGWLLRESGEKTVAIGDGSLTIRIDAPDTLVWTRPGTVSAIRDFEARVTVNVPTQAASFGFLFRQTSDRNYYVFDMTTAGAWRFRARINDEWVALANGFGDPVAPGTYTLEMSAEGARFTASFDGAHVASVEDDRLPVGMVGLAAGSFRGTTAAPVSFDAFRLAVPGALFASETPDTSETSPANPFEDSEDLVETIYLRETFDDDLDRWMLWEEPGSNSTIEDGVLNLTVWEPSRMAWSFPLNLSPLADFRLEMDFTVQRGGPMFLGALFRADGNENFYMFQMTTAERYGMWIFTGFEDNEWMPEPIAQGALPPEIQVGAGTHRLEIIAYGDIFRFLLDGQVLGTVSDARFDRGGLGLLGGTFGDSLLPARAAFDNVIVRELRTFDLLDTFEDDTGRWETWQDARSDSVWEDSAFRDGALVLTVREPDWMTWARARAWPLPEDFRFAADWEVRMGAPLVGLAFRAQDADNYYLYQVDTARRVWQARAFINGTWAELPIASGALPPGLDLLQGIHTLEVVADGPVLTFLLDDSVLGAGEDAAFTEGQVGMAVGSPEGGASAAFHAARLQQPATR